ncbi:MAG: acyl-CoA dehydrogenase [Planctomycetota bacterium]|nr:acyl-CoA dehydrogenase [Planctomycetota bacterium]
MDFALSVEQQRWHDAALKFARDELNDDVIARDDRAEFWRDGWTRCARFGLAGLPIPAEFGGQGVGLPETIAAMEGLGYGCADNGLIFGLNAALWTVAVPLLTYGTVEQKQRFLPGLCDGSLIGANAASEPGAGSDIFSMKATAERRGDHWILNGHKTWCTNAPTADLFSVYATADTSLGLMGITAFLVPRETPGFRVVREIPKMGLRTVPMGEVVLDDCRVPDNLRLGRQGRGAEVFSGSMEWERGAILASTLGTMRRQLERCVAHARSREQFGQPIGKFQSVSNRIVDMALRLETCRSLVYKIGWLKSLGRDATTEAAMAKLLVSECFVQNSLDAVRTFGASGYVCETGIERDLRDSVGSLIFSGTNDVQRMIVAKRMGL